MRHLFLFPLITVLLVSCWVNNPSEAESVVGKEDVVATAAERALSERAIIDSVATSWGWGDLVLPGGIRYAKYGHNTKLNSAESLVYLDVYVDLLNGNKCYWLDSIEVEVGKYAGIRAVDEISKVIGLGDSIVALVPSDFGHGLAGLPGVVPPGAMLKVTVSQQFHQEAQ